MTNLQVRNGKVFGSLDGDTVRKVVRKSKHLFRKWDAWGLDCDFFDEMVEQGAKHLEILDKEEEVVYTIGMDAEWAGFKRDWGWGEQYFIPRKYFNREDSKR